jgi:membrane protease YdiL (CAAX protease family)
MLSVALILGFPLILGVGFAGGYAIAYVLRREARGLDQAGFLLYPFFLMIPLGPALADAVRGGGLWDFGVADPVIGRLPGTTALATGAALGIGLAVLLFRGEIAMGRWLARRRPERGSSGGVMEGRSARLSGGGSLSLPTILIIDLVVVVADEFLWRGYLPATLRQRYGVPAAWTLLIAAVSFGLNHTYFGLRSVVAKSVAGWVWGLAAAATGSLWIPVVSHYAFDVLAWRRLRR